VTGGDELRHMEVMGWPRRQLGMPGTYLLGGNTGGRNLGSAGDLEETLE
jgi:hypothetical protein